MEIKEGLRNGSNQQPQHLLKSSKVLWKAVGADDAVVMFEGTGPGCRGAAVQAGTLARRPRRLDGLRGTIVLVYSHVQVVHEKPETRRHVVFKHKTWDEQWVPANECGKQAILRDRRAEVEVHDNDVYVGEVLYFLESKAPLRPNIRKGRMTPSLSR
eukprot:jgi/Tetstr1/422781/TSEL_013578.t1